MLTQPHNIIALVYDFDLTLSPDYMQNHTILRHAELDPATFWDSCTALIKSRDYDHELAYMKRMLEEPRIRSLSNQDLRDMGSHLSFFPGVPTFFEELNKTCVTGQHKLAYGRRRNRRARRMRQAQFADHDGIDNLRLHQPIQ